LFACDYVGEKPRDVAYKQALDEELERLKLCLCFMREARVVKPDAQHNLSNDFRMRRLPVLAQYSYNKKTTMPPINRL
jgi:hypothetical protein